MTKDEMKNRISMALKDPILQQGFEIICKNLAELEKEKADLIQEKYNLEYKIENLENKVEHHQEVIDTLQKKIAKLKECLTVGTTWNKGLNSRNKFLEEDRDKHRNMVFDKMEQLDKAIELLAKWVKLFKPKNKTTLPTPIQTDTEQFLKEFGK